MAGVAVGGNIVLLRHAAAPGVGDPPEFRLDDCATQRNLSAEGRAQARRIGEALRRRGVEVDAVYSSEWCRCLQTAELDRRRPGDASSDAELVLRSGLGAGGAANRGVRAWLAGQRPRGSLILVTHQVNITALTGIVPASGEAVVGKSLPSGLVEVVGRIPPP